MFAFASTAGAQITGVQVAASATQAVVAYTAPDTNVCSIDVRELSTSNPLVPDVDPSIFPGSNLDSRSVSLNTGRRRVFVLGKRAAEPGLDGFYHSRALQANTLHVLKIVCGGATFSNSFTTANIPLGMTYNDPLPADPNNPGQYAWPTINWTDRTKWHVDPFTGVRLKLLDTPDTAIDGGVGYPGTFAGVSGTNWNNPANILSDDNAAATYSGSTRDWLFLRIDQAWIYSAIHWAGGNSLAYLFPSLNAWCSDPSCSSAAAADRTIQVCVTIDGSSCATDMLEYTLTACSSGCTNGGAPYRFDLITNPQPMMADWFASNGGISKIDLSDVSRRSGAANRTGASVTTTDGDRFNLKWDAGTKITINGVAYTIASVQDDQNLTLQGSPSGSDSGVSWVSNNNVGFLLRKKTTSTTQISIQFALFNFGVAWIADWDAGGDTDIRETCSSVQVVGPGSEMGYHCYIGGTLYWIGSTSGTVNRLGRLKLPAVSGADGWGERFCSPGYWDETTGNSYYCLVTDVNNNTVLVQATYSGNNTDVGPVGAYTPMVACGTPPCWTFINRTPASTGHSVSAQLAAFHPLWNAYGFVANSIEITGRSGNTLNIFARIDGSNDTLAFQGHFDMGTNSIVAASPSWAYWPLRWGGIHGAGNLNDPNYSWINPINFRGPLSGNDSIGDGPYISTVTSGPISTTGTACPAQPAGSPVTNWPTGNNCIVITVDGEPQDPSPAYYGSGTITTSGTSVTLTGGSWPARANGRQILIGGTFYTFTYLTPTTGTLSGSPNVSGSTYQLFLEPVNNPKTASPLAAYLMDAAPRDLFCVVAPGQSCRGQYGLNEWMRLLIKSGNTWTLERGFAGSQPRQAFLSYAAGAWMLPVPPSCYLTAQYPCPDAHVLWPFTSDPYGYNASNGMLSDNQAHQGGHQSVKPGLSVGLGDTCPSIDGLNNGCYNARTGYLPSLLTNPSNYFSANPTWHGLAGPGEPNSVDIHPSHTHWAASKADQNWFTDARPFLGDDNGQYAKNGSIVNGTLYKFTAANTPRLRPRIFPTLAACGANPLVDVSGPSSLIGGGAADNYKYCVALKGNECVGGSSPGDVYVNCPQTRLNYCSYQGVGGFDPDTRDICIADLGAYTLNATQVYAAKSDPAGQFGRRISAAFSRYHWVDQFWNVKTTPDGKWAFLRSSWMQGLRTSVLLAKLPPFPGADSINRGDYVPVTISVKDSANNAVVRFGYNPNFYCTSRQEVCVQGSAAPTAGVSYASDNPVGVPCTNGCQLTIPAIAQRALYYQVVLRDASNNVVGTLSPEVRISDAPFRPLN